MNLYYFTPVRYGKHHIRVNCFISMQARRLSPASIKDGLRTLGVSKTDESSAEVALPLKIHKLKKTLDK